MSAGKFCGVLAAAIASKLAPTLDPAALCGSELARDGLRSGPLCIDGPAPPMLSCAPSYGCPSQGETGNR